MARSLLVPLVMVLHDQPKAAPAVYLVAIDGTPTALHVVQMASTLAAALGGRAELHIVHVIDVAPASVSGIGMNMFAVAPADLLEVGRRALDVACTDAGGLFLGHIMGHLAAGYPWREIVSAASLLNADLVVVGTAGRTGFERFALGSVAEMVVRHAGCPVLVVRPKKPAARALLERRACAPPQR